MKIWTRAPLLALAATAVAAPTAEAATKPPTVTAMTRNLYLGGDIFRPIGATDKADFERRTGELWAIVQQTNFAARAKLIAREVKRTKPDLIGLQEVSLWRRGTKDDPAPATEVVYDWERIFRRELRRAGLSYVLGRRQREADIEGPVSQGFDIRLTMHDVILVRKRKGLRITGRASKNYKADIGVPTPVGQLTSTRGWAYVNLRVNGRRMRFVTTHLESASDPVRVAQANELVGRGGPLRTKLPTILVGDMNSDEQGRGGDGPGAYQAITGFGMVDSWKRLNPSRPGLTFGFSETVTDVVPPSPFTKRIDYVFSRGRKLTPLRSTIVGIDPRNRTSSGLWPSDHAGVVTKYRLR